MKKIITNLKKLREISKPVYDIQEIKDIILDLKKTISVLPHGIGLGAIQIGIAKKIAVIKTNNTYLELINPEIVYMEEEFTYIDEGCLSLPNRGFNTKRYRHIDLKNYYIDGEELKEQQLYFYYGGKNDPNSDGLVAIAIQHELDHMNGILTMDHNIKPEVTAIQSDKVGRNDPCPCGSGKKYKKCCLK